MNLFRGDIIVFVENLKVLKMWRRTWVAQSVKSPTPDIGSGLILEWFEPHIELQAGHGGYLKCRTGDYGKILRYKVNHRNHLLSYIPAMYN